MSKFALVAQKSIAENSPDHISPRGTKQDNSHNPLFNKKLYALFANKPLQVLDFGCAGGAFVKSCIDDGHSAVGLEGSDYSQKTGRAEWGTIPDNLFTCDITANFQIKSTVEDSSEETKFDVITAWEFMEHISGEDLAMVCDNAIRHLKEGGLWIMSIADFDEIVGKINYHQTVQSKEWWLEFFSSKGFTNHPELVDYFGDDWVRGPQQGSESFHLVLAYGDFDAPEVPVESPLSQKDLIDAGLLCVEKTIANGVYSNLNLDYALTLFDRVEQQFGEVDELNYARALTMLYQGRTAEAKITANLVYDLQSEHVGAKQIITQVDMLNHLNTVEGFDEYLLRLNRGIRFRERGNLEASRNELERVVEIRPEDAVAKQCLRDTLKLMAKRMLDEVDFQKAASLLDRFPSPQHSDPEWHFLTAQVIHFQKQDLAHALHHYDLALEFGYDVFGIYLHRGILMREAGNIADSIGDLQRALEIQPDNQDVIHHLEESKKLIKPQQPVISLDPAETLQFLLTSDDLQQALKAHQDKLDVELLDLVKANAQTARKDGHHDLSQGLENLAEYLEEVISKKPPKTTATFSVSGSNGLPKISIVTPVYNCGELVRTCIESVLAQNYPNFEHIIVDGASTDGTVEVIKEYPHIKWISEPDEGEAEALNKALRMVSGDFIGWLNADDSYLDGTLKKVIQKLQHEPECHLIYGKTLFVDEEGIPTNWVIPYAPLDVVSLTRWYRLNLFQPSMFFSTKLLHDVGFYREDLEYGVDYEYWFRIAAKGYKFHYIDHVLSKAMIYRSGGKTGTPYNVKVEEWLEICGEYLASLDIGTRIHFWKDFYEFRIRMHKSDFYFDGAPIPLPETREAISGYTMALKELGLMSDNLNPVLNGPGPDTSNLQGLLADFFHQNNRVDEANKAFEWALAIESQSPVVKQRFGI